MSFRMLLLGARWAALALWLFALAACAEISPLDPQRIQQAAGSGDASSEGKGDAQGSKEVAVADLDAGAKLGCGSITNVGCCDGETLWWCEQGVLKNLHCGARPHCGWSSTGNFHDCNTAGASDPANQHAKECLLVTDGALPRTDAPPRDGGGSCQGVTTEGCCAGSTLLYCVDGNLRALHCGLNPSCGWLPNAQYYDCGTEGLADPKGVYPKPCPIPAPDGLAIGLRDAGGEALPELGLDLAGDPGSKDGCSCSLGAPPRVGAWLWLWAVAALLLAARRRQVR